MTVAWSVKDLIAQVTWWEAEARTHMPLILRGGRPARYSTQYGGIDAINALMTEQKHGLSLPEVMHQQEETHRRLLAYLHNVPEEQLTQETRFRHRLWLDSYGHYPLHTNGIRDWRAQHTAATAAGSD